MPPDVVKRCICLGTNEELLTYRAAEVRYRFNIYCERLRAATNAAARADGAGDVHGDEEADEGAL